MSLPTTIELNGTARLRDWGRRWWIKVGLTGLCFFLMWRVWPENLRLLERIWTKPWFFVAAVCLRPFFTLTLGIRTAVLASLALEVGAWRQIVRTTYIGQMFSLFLPGGIGGDVVRGALLQRLTGARWSLVVGVLAADRIFGLVSLLCYVVVFSVPILVGHGVIFSGWSWLLALGAAAFLAGLTRRWWVDRLGALLGRTQRGSDLLAAAKRVRGPKIAIILLLAMLGHGILLLSGGLVFECLSPSVGWADRIGVLSASFFLATLPLTVGGHGMREGTLVWLLTTTALSQGGDLLLPMDGAIAMAVALFVIHLGTNLVGGLVAMLWSKARPQPAPASRPCT